MNRPRRPDLWLGLGLAASFGALYLATMCRAVYWYDSAEYVAAAVTIGIPHPPGYPLYTLIAHLFTWLPVDPAVAVNAVSAVFGAVAVGLAFGAGRALGLRRPAAAFSASLLGAGTVFWGNAVVAEVYTPGLAVFFAVLWLLARGVRENRPRLLVGASALAGAGMGVHMSIATTGVGLGLLVLGTGVRVDRPRELARLFSRDQLRRRLLVAAACLGAAAAAAALVFAWLPLRASMHPALNFGDPETWQRLVWHVTGGNYKHWFDVPTTGGRALRIATSLGEQLGWVGIALAAAGAVLGLRRRPLACAALVAMAAGNLYFFFDYKVHDVEVFFLPTTAALCLLAGFGVQEIADALRPGLSRGVAVALGALPLAMAVGSFAQNDLSDYTAARDYGEALTRELPAGAVIANFTTPPEWQRNAVFHDYFQIVRGARPDVTVLTRPPAQRLGQLVASGRPVYLYYPVGLMTGGSFTLVPEGHLVRVRLSGGSRGR